MTIVTSSAPAEIHAPNRPRRITPGRILLILTLTLGLAATLLPFVWMLLGAFKTNAEIMRRPVTWWPQAPTMDNFRAWFVDFDMSRYFFNSVFLALVAVATTLLFCSMVGWALAKLEFPGKRVLIGVVLSTMFVPGIVTLIPTFVLVANFNMVGTYWGMILPGMVGAFGVFLMRQFMLEIPDSLLDAARIDGAGEFRIFGGIVMPLCRAPLATLAIFTFMGSWNGFLWPLIVAQRESLYTLPVALALYTSPTGDKGAEFGLQMAGSVLIIVPVLLVFIAMQKHFVQGIAMTGIK
ncbi:carbohydrate ABC transporter membrane protein 2 (CUT1 family) [Salana multivorans]|uniref:Carbohydrate ABC transporter membrane protein 2 (CUT1 family) n=1 Tax=Salana multivorans TaxID=120377 RepID=A0A3N2D1I2_9MICO|nr:carbohydrate ABC transporter permease [Salana multivorans]MBN8883592.1 carbohydrate ABC transporter permease [Salana multivorans]OJX94420.1 MAG: sugar ABC transporter permease [Micrococcales bacterium 73-15]ROR93632.1 carbohydrate ABC transporter membrane protein 2 (CUT1 family) [Salana multivorans]